MLAKLLSVLAPPHVAENDNSGTLKTQLVHYAPPATLAGAGAAQLPQSKNLGSWTSKVRMGLVLKRVTLS